MLHPIFLFLNIGSSEMILIVFVALLLFGGDKLPQLAKGLGKGIRDFKDASEGVKRELQNQINNFEEKPVSESAPGYKDSDLNLAAIENTAPVSDPFFTPAAVQEHETETHEAAEPGNPAQEPVAEAGEGHADVSHLVTGHTEVNQVAENHLSLSHVSDEAGAKDEPEDKKTV